MRGNVVPQKGPGMEDIYDYNDQDNFQISKDNYIQKNHVNRTQLNKNNTLIQSNLSLSLNNKNYLSDFKKIPNPELKLYVYPHFTGKEEVPIPGYYTFFNVYDHDHYMLRNER